MSTPAKRLLLIPTISTLALVLVLAHGATAQSATGTVTGRVVWGPCIRGIPLPLTPEGQTQPATPGAPNAQPAPGQPIPVPGPGQPIPATGLPAGAVLVAVQNTAINARTDEAGRFSLSGVPAGMYMTVAAGPVANSVSAIAERPNVFVNGGQSVDVGTLSLGGPTTLAIACRFVPGVGAATGAEPTTPDTGTPPPSDVPPNP
jgi:hypothetical protein